MFLTYLDFRFYFSLFIYCCDISVLSIRPFSRKWLKFALCDVMISFNEHTGGFMFCFFSSMSYESVIFLKTKFLSAISGFVLFAGLSSINMFFACLPSQLCNVFNKIPLNFFCFFSVWFPIEHFSFISACVSDFFRCQIYMCFIFFRWPICRKTPIALGAGIWGLTSAGHHMMALSDTTRKSCFP